MNVAVMDNHEFCASFVSRLGNGAPVRVLDYGCGAGRLVRLLRSAGHHAYGCDIFYGGGSYRGEVDPHDLASGIITDMPQGITTFPDASFDVVITNQVIEHVPDLPRMLGEVCRVLAPGGVMLSLFPYRGTWREGHCGIPFLHRFPKGSRLRVYYAAALRAAGLGHFKKEKTALQWSRDFCRWLDEWTHYRTYRELRDQFEARFTGFTHHEAEWLVMRAGALGAWLRRVPAPLRALLACKLGGLVITCRKPGHAPRPPADSARSSSRTLGAGSPAALSALEPTLLAHSSPRH